MCVAAIYILFYILPLIVGLWLLISGKIPNKLFQLLFGKGNYQLSSLQTRLFGLLISSPMPMAYGASFALAIFFPKNHLDLSLAFEITYDFIVAIVAIIIARKSRHSVPQKNPIPTSSGDNVFK
jgi:hypothetical protein